jgi:L-aspartate oxidase
MPLASEALRGEGAILINELNERFTDELQARDIVTRAIWQQLTEGHRVFLDATAALGKKFAARFPTIYAICATAGIDPSFSPIPVRPAAHYHMGGVLTDARGRTDVRGLWACGEVACTGLHGANRLASNSLLEAASFGRRVAEDLASSMHGDPFIGVESGRSTSGIKALEENLVHDVDDATRRGELAIRPLLSDHVGVVRSRRGLQRTIDFLSPMANQSDKALVGLLVARAALRREESRGAHFRTDFLETQIAAQRFTTCLEDLEM